MDFLERWEKENDQNTLIVAEERRKLLRTELRVLKEVRAYLVEAHDDALPILDEHDSDIVDDTKRLIEEIDRLLEENQ